MQKYSMEIIAQNNIKETYNLKMAVLYSVISNKQYASFMSQYVCSMFYIILGVNANK